jgi:ParB/RepB/Spo0J family partition protein
MAKSAVQTVETDDLGKLEWIDIDLIDPDSFENQRTGDFTIGAAPDEGSSFNDLVDSIETTGQKDPITVRLKKTNGETKVKAKKGQVVPIYEVVKGFRRYAAVKRLGQKANNGSTAGVKIKAVVKELTDLQALEENVFENTARDNLSGCDLAWAAFRLGEQYKLAGVKISDAQLAGRMGKNQTYITKLVKIVRLGLQSGVAQKWRESAAALPIDTVKRISEMSPELQVAEYDKMVAAGAGKAAKGPGGKPVYDIAVSQVKRVGTLLGKLVKADLISTEITWTNESHLTALGVKFPEGEGAFSKEDKRNIGKAGKEAFELAQEDPPAKEEPAVAAAN